MKMDLKNILILVIPFILLAVVYLFLPPIIPRQFGLDGKPVSYMAKEFIFLFGFLPFILYRHFKSRKG